MQPITVSPNRIVDSNVVVLAVYAFGQLNSQLNEPSVAFDNGNPYRLINKVIKCCNRPTHVHAGHFLCSMPSLDVSGRGKRIVWDTWNVYQAITGQFASLLKNPQLDDVEPTT